MEVTRRSFMQGAAAAAAGSGAGLSAAGKKVRVSAIVEDRTPAVSVWEAIAYTAPGIVAHQSALRGGEPLKIKDYGRAPA